MALSSKPPSGSTSVSSFGELLRRHRRAAGFTQAELAERAGLSSRGLNDLERGARTAPRRETTRLLADALGLAGNERADFLAAGRRGAARPGAVPTDAPRATDPAPAPTALPTGTVTFLFTDIERSTRLLQRLGDRYASVLADHQALLRAAWAAHGGHEVDTQGDSFFVVFSSAPAAVAAATEATRALAAHPWPEGIAVRVRIGLHAGAPLVTEGRLYVGLDVHRAARIAAAGHGGQVLLSAAAAELGRHDLPPGLALRNLGAHRLKDLDQPERIWQLVLTDVQADFPPLRALDARPHNLPVQTSALLGREREVAALGALLEREDVRLVTRTGPGGVGKTRLSFQVAAEVLDAYPDGVWSVRLSRLSDPALVLPTIATTLDVKESGTMPLAELLRAFLRDKHLLLVLDNFEHVAAAAPALGAIMEVCPGVRALVTSRVALHLRGEREYALAPLALPDAAHLPPPERLSHYAAVALFIERARATQADFAVTPATAAVVAAICARLDGLPLAIELAAARVKVLPPPALLKRLEHALPLLTGGARDLDARQRTMRDTLAWSYDLLQPEEQRLFWRLAVFVGGCSLEAAETVCVAPEGAEPLGFDVLDGLSALLDHSLIQQREEGGEPRFGMLHIVREYALELLEASGEGETMRLAHAEFFGRRAADWLARLAARSDAPREPLVRSKHAWIERERENIRAVLGWAMDHGEPELGLGVARILMTFWVLRGIFAEGRYWLEGLLELPPSAGAKGAATPNPGQLARLREHQAIGYHYAGTLAGMQGGGENPARSVALLEEGVRRLRALGDLPALADALLTLAAELADVGDVGRAEVFAGESLRISRRLGRTESVALGVAELGVIAFEGGDLERARSRARRALRLIEHAANTGASLFANWTLARVALGYGDADEARARVRAALRWQEEHDQSINRVVPTLELLCQVEALAGRDARVAYLQGALVAPIERTGAEQPPSWTREVQAAVAKSRDAFGEEAWQAAYAAGRALTLEEAVAEALGEDEG